MAGTHLSVEDIGEMGGLNDRFFAGWLHLFDRWDQHGIDAGIREEPEVGFFCAWVVGQISGLAELRRIHKDRGDDPVAFDLGAAHEGHMPGVECTHRGDQPDAVARSPVAGNFFAVIGNAATDLHARVIAGRNGGLKSLTLGALFG